jgi:hypothetical protein
VFHRVDVDHACARKLHQVTHNGFRIHSKAHVTLVATRQIRASLTYGLRTFLKC